MFHYSPSSPSQAYTSYLPRRSHFPASSNLDDATLPAYIIDGLEYQSLSHSFLPPRSIDAETRYRRALYELEAAEREYAQVALERARQANAIHQRAAAEAARREREIALYAEIERINRGRALQEQVEERPFQRQRALRTHVPFERAHRGGHAPIRAIYGDAERDYDPQDHRVRPQLDNETLTIGDVLGLFSGVHPERQSASPHQGPTLSTSQPHRPTEPQTQPQPPEREEAEVNLSNIMEFCRSIAAQARGAGDREQSSDESLPSQPEATAVEGKGKGKAKTQPAPERTLFETLFREIVGGAHDQELEDAIKVSLQDRDATDVKKAHASKTSQSRSGASSSKVKVEDPSSSGRAGCPTRNSAPVSEPVSPLTSIRAVRTQFSALESAFKFPLILDFDHSELAATSNNAPVRAYEHALSDLLERLDAIESGGNEEVRDVRRRVVREVERALEEVEGKVKEQTPQIPVAEVTKQEGDVKSEDPSASASQAVLPAVVHVTEAAERTLSNLAPVASQADADIDVTISEEYQSASPVSTPSGVVVAEQESAAGAAPANGETSTGSGGDTEIVPAFKDGSDSLATITAAPVAPAVAVPSPSDKSASTSAGAGETFLASLSQDQFTFPPRPAFSRSSTNSGVPQDDDAILVDNSSEGGSVRSVDDEWTAEFEA